MFVVTDVGDINGGAMLKCLEVFAVTGAGDASGRAMLKGRY